MNKLYQNKVIHNNELEKINPDVQIEELYSVLQQYNKADDYIRDQMFTFCSEFGQSNAKKAEQLFQLILQKYAKDDHFILSNLLIGLYKSDEEHFFKIIKDLLKDMPLMVYSVLGKLDYSNEKHILDCFTIAENISTEDIDRLLQIPNIYTSLIKSTHTPTEIRQKCFDNLGKLFVFDNEKLRNAIFFNLRFIKGYEKERYIIFANTILVQSENYWYRVNDFFLNYSNSFYFFDLFLCFCKICSNHNSMINANNIKLFSESFKRFWRVDKNNTEKHLLLLLSHNIPYLRIGAVWLIYSSSYYNVNLLSLDTEQKQLRALEALFFNCFCDINKFIPLLLSLQQSPYQKVVLYLQEKLSELILEAYPYHLYEEITKIIKDKTFLKPLKNSVDEYNEIKKIKTSINDLNPQKNEHDLMELYFKLEQEEHGKMINEINSDKNSFLSMLKSSTVVRGNSVKFEDNQIVPMTSFDSAVIMDYRMYKNPDLFNHIHHVFNSQF